MAASKSYDPSKLGQVLAAWLVRELHDGGPESLGVQLSESVQPHNLNRFLREVYLFFLVPIELAIILEAPPESERVRMSLIDTLLELVNLQLASVGARAIPSAEWRSLVALRFEEYSQIAPADSSKASNTKLLQLLFTNLGLPTPLPQRAIAARLHGFFAILLPYACELIQGYGRES